MRTEILFSNIDASQPATSGTVHIDQRVQWHLTVEKTGTDGDPNVFIEQAFNGGGQLPQPSDWYPLPNVCEAGGGFAIDDTIVGIEKNSLKGNWFRIRVEPNGTTTGTLDALFAYKTFP